ncbi:MAG: twin-arginine translocation signal domain-containing protein, partial [Solirubrobacterales bacterium]
MDRDLSRRGFLAGAAGLAGAAALGPAEAAEAV